MPKNCPRTAQENLNEIQLKILELVNKNNKITQQEIANYINVSRDKVKHNMLTLKKQNILIREGSTKNGTWKVNK